ncbi:MAG: cytochrome c maturation protein CcmE [Legionella sp.]|nr:cytochrome c maturation protein CcmE [Legionella sp.]
MIPSRRNKLVKISFLLAILAAVTTLVLYALRQNISLFYTPSDMFLGIAPMHHKIRIGGMVEKGSVLRDTQNLRVRFKLTDFRNSIEVSFTGILPDLFREGQGVVAEGELINNNSFNAVQVLAKHDANYMPPEVKAALGKQGGS